MEISVLISVYDKEKAEYLKESLESILNQTLMPKQIVIIKDGKLTKELEEVLKHYKKEFFDLIDIYSLDKKVGLGEALKFGIEKCKYDYIARMDTDDIAPRYRFKEQVEIFKENKNLDLLGGYIEEYEENMQKLESIRKVPLKLEEIKKYMKTQSPFNHGTVIMRKQAVIDAGNYSNVCLEDYDLWARMLIAGCNMMNTDLILGKNRTGKNMYKRRSGIKRIKQIVEIEKKLLSYGIINEFEYICNIVIRSLVAVLPISLKKHIYAKSIRKIGI